MREREYNTLIYLKKRTTTKLELQVMCTLNSASNQIHLYIYTILPLYLLKNYFNSMFSPTSNITLLVLNNFLFLFFFFCVSTTTTTTLTTTNFENVRNDGWVSIVNSTFFSLSLSIMMMMIIIIIISLYNKLKREKREKAKRKPLYITYHIYIYIYISCKKTNN